MKSFDALLIRLFQLALRSLPADFRRAYGPDILAVARERARSLPTDRDLLRFWGREILDLLRTSLRERWHRSPSLPHRRPRPTPGPKPNHPQETRTMFDTLGQHLKFALRGLLQRPAFTALVVLLLALGIGTNTAMFSLLHGVLLKPLPFEEPDRLVRLYGSWTGGNVARVSPPDFLDYREQNEAFSALAAFTSFQLRLTITGEGEPERVPGALVTANFFDTVGVAPRVGRGFGEAEARPGGDRAVILSHGYWQRNFGGDPAVVDSTLMVNGQAHTVLGVMPPGFSYPATAEGVALWLRIPHAMLHESQRRFHFLNPVGRLKPEVTLEQADEDLNLIAARLEATYPESNDSWRVRLIPLQEDLLGDFRTPLLLLFGAVGLLLLIACGNVASLLLARALARQREMAVRSALGAGRARILGQLLTESGLLALLGGGAGVLLAHGFLAALRSFGPEGLPRLEEVSLSVPVLAFALSLSLLTGLLFGLAPAFHALRLDLVERLKAGGRSDGVGGGRGLGLRSLLVAGQMALSVLLLIGAGLLLQSFGRLLAVDPGFEPRGALTASLELPRGSYPEPADGRRFFQDLLRRARALPGVESAGGISQLPMMGGGDTYVHAEGRPPETPAQRQTAQLRTATAGYFKAMGMELAAGRTFAAVDGENAPPVVVVNRALVQRDFDGAEPAAVLGERLVIDLGEPVAAEIIGVVGDVREFGRSNPTPEILYLAQNQYPNATLYLVLRTPGEPLHLAEPLRALVRDLDPNLPVSGLSTLDTLVADSSSQPRFRTWLLGFFAATALLLAAVGLYGMLATFVGQRSHEMGVRMALGADRRAVLGLVLRRGLMLAALGIAVGVLGALFATRLLSGLLFGVGALDPGTFLAVPCLLLLVAVVACLVPARRATRVDPTVAFRSE